MEEGSEPTVDGREDAHNPGEQKLCACVCWGGSSTAAQQDWISYNLS